MFKIVLLFTFLGTADPPPPPFDGTGAAVTQSSVTFGTRDECENFRTGAENRVAVLGLAQALADYLKDNARFMLEASCRPVGREA